MELPEDAEAGEETPLVDSENKRISLWQAVNWKDAGVDTPHRLKQKDKQEMRARILRAAWLVEDVLYNEVQLRPDRLKHNFDIALANVQREILQRLYVITLVAFIFFSFFEKPEWMYTNPYFGHYPLYFPAFFYLDTDDYFPIELGMIALLLFCFLVKIYLLRGQIFNGLEPLSLRLPIYVEMVGIVGTTIRAICRWAGGTDFGIGHIFRITIFVAATPALFNMWKLIFTLVPRICSVLILLAMFLLFFSWSFWWIFLVAPGVTDISAFNKISKSYWSLFQLLTTTNFPEVMMPFYEANPPNSLLFVGFIVVGVFFLLNIVVALVYYHYEVLNAELQVSYRVLHAKNIRAAFKLLDITDSKRIGVEELIFLLDELDMFTIMGAIQCARVQKSLFKLKSKKVGKRTDSGGEFIDLDEFEGMIKVLASEFRNVGPQSPLEVYFPELYRTGPIQALVLFVRGKERTNLYKDHEGMSDASSTPDDAESAEPKFSYVVDGIILLHLFLLIAAVIDPRTKRHATIYKLGESIFINFYMAELCLNLLVLGPSYYWRPVRNRIDSFFIFGVFFALHVDEIDLIYFHWMNVSSTQSLRIIQSLISFRTVKLVRHLKMAPNFYNLMMSVDVALSSSITLLLVLFSFMYASASYGVSQFGGALCQAADNVKIKLSANTTFCEDNSGIDPNSYFASQNYYWNNFNDLPGALTVIFEIFVVNDIWDIAAGIGIATGKMVQVRIYFLFNYIFGTLVLMNLVLAVIVTATIDVYSKAATTESTGLEGLDISALFRPFHRGRTNSEGSIDMFPRGLRQTSLAYELAQDLDKSLHGGDDNLSSFESEAGAGAER